MRLNGRLHRFRAKQGKNILDAWFALQLTRYGGKYSVERMLSLEEYTRNASLARVVLVSVGVPLIIFSLVLGQESIPLQNPRDSWRSNYGFWIRVAFLGGAVGYAAASQLAMWLDVPDLSSRQKLVFCSLTSVGFVAVGTAAAEVWVFPIPFFILSLSVVWPVLLVGFLRVVVGARAFSEICSRRGQLRRMNKLGALHGFVCAVYPAYQVLFKKANQTSYELPVMLCLPVLKLVLKAVFVSAASHKQDVVPEQVVFTVDFFDAFYLATFLPMLSWTTLAAVLTIHYVQTALELRELHQRTRSILSRLRATDIIGAATNHDMLTTLRSLCYYSETLQEQNGTNIRIYSSISQRLSPEGRTVLSKFGNYPQHSFYIGHAINPIQVRPDTTIGKPNRGLRSVGAVQPLMSLPILPKYVRSTDVPNNLSRMTCKHRPSLNNTSKILQEALEVLFTSECLVLMEYVEIVIPVHYGIFVFTMAHMPSSQYHTEMAGITRENVGEMVSRMFIYGVVEFILFIVLAVITKRNCGIGTVYQLGYVLETQMHFVFSNLMLWIGFILTYRVVHFGADFSFEFNWINHPDNE